MSHDVEVLVVGGGLAGSTLSTLLARAGHDVLVIERGEFPRDKLCGEFLSPESQSILRASGVIDRIERVGPVRINRARFIGRSERHVAIRLPAAAYGISRKRLDEELFEACKAAGATAWTKSEVVGIEARTAGGHMVTVRRPAGEMVLVKAATVVCAHGRRGRPDHALNRKFLKAAHPFVGLKRHHRPADTDAGRDLAAELEDHVEIYPFAGGYCGMSFIETGEVNVCLLAHQDVLRSTNPGWSPVMNLLADEHPALARRLSALVPTDPQPLAVAAVPFSPKSRYERGVFFVGDAAGMIAPLAGDGQAMALDSAHRLAEILTSALEVADRPPIEHLGRTWDRQWRRAYGTRMALADRLQRMLLAPRSAEWVLRGVGAVPGLPDLLARWTRGR